MHTRCTKGCIAKYNGITPTAQQKFPGSAPAAQLKYSSSTTFYNGDYVRLERVAEQPLR